tara:strand:- start:3020 stop:5287 length:2268 start_codon:yes stop_codon:yes gene_type:complete
MLRKIFTLLLFGIFTYYSFGQGLYDEANITVISLNFSQSNWDQVLDNYYAIGLDERLVGTAEINGVFFDSVGVKYKGNSSYNPNNTKNPLNIKLDYIINQDYEGYYTLKLSNGDKDPTFVREVLSYYIAGNYTDCPKANYAEVYINGNYIGLYVSVESINKKFVSEQFYSDDDNILFKCNPKNLGGGGSLNCIQGIGSSLQYLGTDTTCYEDYYELQSDFGWEEMKDFTYNIDSNTGNIEEYFDMDRGIWFLAINNLLVNLDSYIGPFCQNYYLFKDDNNRFLPIVWDFNESFGHFSMINTPGPGNPPSSILDLQEMDPFLRQGDNTRPICNIIYATGATLNITSTYRKMYVAHLKTIINEFFSNNNYSQKANSLHNLIENSFQNDVNSFYSWSDAVNNINNSYGSGSQTKIGITQLMNNRINYILSQSEFQLSPPSVSNITLSANNPSINSTINISADINSNANINYVYLGHRDNPSDVFTKTPMIDQGGGVFTASINVEASDIEYYIYAENTDAGIFSPERAEHEFYIIPVGGNIVINEFMASNVAAVTDQDGEFDDWIELYNNTNQDINMLGLYLSDNTNPLKWAFPDTIISSNSYLIIWADENGSENGLHANFKLSAAGEEIMLYDSLTSTTLDHVIFGPQNTDMGFARIPNGTGSFVIQNHTFGYNNDNISFINILPDNDIQIYPNPTSEILNIKLNNKTNVDLKVYNEIGKVVYFLNTKNQHIQLNVSDYKPGIYIVGIDNNYVKVIIY